jgi:hypothetical protein
LGVPPTVELTGPRLLVYRIWSPVLDLVM